MGVDERIDELEDDVNSLWKFVKYLEDEVDANYEKDSFEREVRSKFGKISGEIEITEERMGTVAIVHGIEADRVRYMFDELEKEPWDWQTFEDDAGLCVRITSLRGR